MTEEVLFNIKQKQKKYNEVRHELKKKRIVLDEGKEKFGMDEMSQLMKVKNTSEVKGYPFKVIKNTDSKNFKFALKIVPVETKYEKAEHPCYLENIILKELTENIVNKDRSPHITHYLGTQKVSNKCRALKQLNLKRLQVEEKIRTHSNMLISEFVEGGSLDNWIFNTYENDKDISDEQWKCIIFQLIYTIAIIQKYYRMMHNDFHYGNILIDNSVKPGGYYVYNIDGKTYYLKNTGIIPKLWDFEFSMAYSNKIPDNYPNKFIIGPYTYDKKTHTTQVDPDDIQDDDNYNVPYNYNEVYDLHYFLTSLLDLYISQELFDWILKIYPSDLIPEDDNSTKSSTTTESEETSDTTTSTTYTKTRSHSHSTSKGTTKESDSSSSSEYVESTTDTTSSDNKYLSEGRLINGVEEQFDLPTPLKILSHPFFEHFTQKPDDYDESTAIVFNAGF